MPRPTKQTASTADRIIAALKGGNTRAAAAAHARVSFDTFTRMMKSDPEFAEAVAFAEAEAEMECVGVIRKAALPHKVVSVKEVPILDPMTGAPMMNPHTGQPLVKRETTTKTEFNHQAAAWILERRWPAAWQQRKSIDVRNLTDQQLRELYEQLEGEAEGEAGEGGGTAGAATP